MKYSHRQFILIVLLITVFTSCKEDVIYQSKMALPDSGWSYNQPADFKFEIKDTSQLFNMLFNVSHLNTYQWQNLYVKLYTDFPDTKKDTQILSIELADKTGRWYGHQSGKTITAPILLQDHFRFEKPGTYRLRIEQNMRINPVQNIRSLELILEKAKPLPKPSAQKNLREKQQQK